MVKEMLIDALNSLCVQIPVGPVIRGREAVTDLRRGMIPCLLSTGNCCFLRLCPTSTTAHPERHGCSRMNGLPYKISA